MIYIIIGVVLVLILIMRNTATPASHDYTASFGKLSDHLSHWNKGFAIGPLAFTRQLSCTNFLSQVQLVPARAR